MNTAGTSLDLLSGRSLAAGPETHDEHVARYGPLPGGGGPNDVIERLEASGLLGRGGAGFPVGRKWRTIAQRPSGGAVVLINGAEGEPWSAKDRAVMSVRPHALIDGLIVAAEAVGADEAVLYVGSGHRTARKVMTEALGQRRLPLPIRIVDAPERYVAGEESAAVHFINDGDARPTTVPPRPFERGIDGQPTLVQNVESLAYAGLIARSGETASAGLVTIGGVPHAGVREVELGTSIGEIVSASGARREATQAILLGGYFGRWAPADSAWDLAYDPAELRAAGLTAGCGVIRVLGAAECGVETTSQVMAYLAGQSAAQCGPCVFGLRAIADATERLARGMSRDDDLARIERWGGQLVGRGACRHPDGAAGFLASALLTFSDEFQRHARTRRCGDAGRPARVA
jgi:NADH:ubiquinone oxidoreductase subunit F (NADH-binding)